MDLLANLAAGFQTALSYEGLLFCFIGVTLGTLVGVLPGIGPLAAISMALPVTFYLDPTSALIMLAGIFYGSQYGGSTASILLNLAGTATSAVTCLDGYPMTKQGRAGVALFITTVTSFVGGSFAILLLIGFAPLVAQFALRFGSAEYFSIMVLGLIAASTLSAGSPLKGLAAVIVGVILGLVGMDVDSGVWRFTLGFIQLTDGISLVAMAMGLFGVAEILNNVGRPPVTVTARDVTLRSMIPTSADLRASLAPTGRGALIGSLIGALPGTGPGIASFMAYAAEKRIAKDPSRFGKGAIEGVAGPEAANNAAVQSAFIPTLSLGIPGDAVMAVLLGALMIHGIVPGPMFLTQQPVMFWGLIASFWIGNILLLVLNIPLIGIWVRILTIPYHILYPAMLFFICVGVFSVRNSPFDIFAVMLFGVLGYFMNLFHYPPAPMLLGFILGPLMEEHFKRELRISQGDFTAFIDRPLSALFLAAGAIILTVGLVPVVKTVIGNLRARRG